MAENATETIVSSLRENATQLYPRRGELRNIRIVGHTPKSHHFIYDLVADFGNGTERIAAKVYRSNKSGAHHARQQAHAEFKNLESVYAKFSQNGLPGVPRPLGNFSELGAVVTEKIQGLPLQSMIMKAALLPGYDDNTLLRNAAASAGEWLRNFHELTADADQIFDSQQLLADLETLCVSCRGEGLDHDAIQTILTGARNLLPKTKRSVPSSAVLNDFTPLNIVVTEEGVGVSDYGKMALRGASFNDAAAFLASVEALEKYPFCNRNITQCVQDSFIHAYGVGPADQALLRILKMRTLLSMFAQGRGIKESAMRKKVMWATVMKRFIQQAANRSLAPAA
ncbi:MAG TPA: phosphotransferase [Terriglobales bacterium]|nr:phosphotransferase [Terriglobales bacterium]